MLIMLAGVGLIVWTAWGFVNRFYPEWLGRPPATESAISDAGGAQARSPTYNVQTIVGANLFGKTETKAAPSVVQQAPETKLKLNLLGVLASANSEYARALIGVQSKQLKAYAIGDQIEGTDAQVHKVESERVILDREGKFESLAMARKNVALN